MEPLYLMDVEVSLTNQYNVVYRILCLLLENVTLLHGYIFQLQYNLLHKPNTNQQTVFIF